jgi:rhodanese-related sulfurtransferase
MVRLKTHIGWVVVSLLSAAVIQGVIFPLPAAASPEVEHALQEMIVEAKDQVPSLTVDELAVLMEEDANLILVDVRTEAEYLAGHLSGALWIPRGKLEFMAAEEKVGSTGDPIVVYCRKDGRASLAAATMKRLGFEKVRYVDGGFESWVTEGHSIYNQHGELMVLEFEKEEK